MEPITFSTLFKRSGGYSLPVLAELYYPGKMGWYFTNNREDIEYEGNLYKATAMDYKFPQSKDGIQTGGSLEITVDENREREELLKWFDEADHRAELRILALINSGGEIKPVAAFSHRYGSLSWDGEKIVWNPGGNDRLEMQSNPWTFAPEALID